MKSMSQYVLAPAYKIYAIIIVSSTSQKSNNMPVHSQTLEIACCQIMINAPLCLNQ